MKKLILILLIGGAALAVSSCSKEEIQPSNGNNVVPTWEESTTKSSVNENANSANDENFGSDITDPNDDEDGNGKKKK